MSERHQPIWTWHSWSASLKSCREVQMLQDKTGVDPFKVPGHNHKGCCTSINNKLEMDTKIVYNKLSQHCSMLRLSAMFSKEEKAEPMSGRPLWNKATPSERHKDSSSPESLASKGSLKAGTLEDTTKCWNSWLQLLRWKEQLSMLLCPEQPAVLTASFIWGGEQRQRKPPSPTRNGRLEEVWDWEMQADVDQQIAVPTEIVTSTLRPDLVLWSNTLYAVYIIELTVPWEDATDETSKRKRLWHAELMVDAEQWGWRATVCPVEVGCCGFIATPTVKLLKELWIYCQALCHTIKDTSETAERCSL